MSGRTVKQSKIQIKKTSQKLKETVPEVPSNTPEEQIEQTSPQENLEVLETSEMLFELIDKQYSLISDSVRTLRTLQKKLKNALKKESKENKMSKKKTERTTPRVETKKPIVDSLATLMNIPKDSELSRQEVHKYICRYIKDNKLQDETDKKCFKTDSALEKVLGKPKFKAHSSSDKISHSYTNLLKMLSSLFKQ